MPEVTICPKCQRNLQVPESLLGHEVQCPECEEIFVARLSPPEANRPQAEAIRKIDTGERYGQDSGVGPRPVPPTRQDMAPHRGGAILTLGILSLVLGCGIGLILGPMAWIMGNNDLQAMDRGTMDPSGRGTTEAGRILGMIGTILSGLAVCLCFLYFAGILAVVGAGAANQPQF